jgi:hypothetical protein
LEAKERMSKKNYEQEGFTASAAYVAAPPVTPAFRGLSYEQIGRIYAYFHTKAIEDEGVRHQAERDFHMGWTHELT